MDLSGNPSKQALPEEESLLEVASDLIYVRQSMT